LLSAHDAVASPALTDLDSFPFEDVSAAVGRTPVRWRRVESGGYAIVNAHWIVEFGEGGSAFVKQALTEEARKGLRRERLLYEQPTPPFMPAYLGAHDADTSMVLVLEDLSDADWPPPWSEARVNAVMSALDAVHATSGPHSLTRLEDVRESVVGWERVAADPEPLVGTGLCSSTWLRTVLPELLRAGEDAVLDGDALLHFDVRSDNLCFAGDRTVLVDWNHACRGSSRFDIAFWAPSLALEGGPQPWQLMDGAGQLSAVVAGFFCSRAGLPPPPGAPTVRAFQRAQAEVALRWTVRELGLPADA